MRSLLLAALLLLPDIAFAHSPIKGVGSFYSGLLHPFLVPAHLIALIVTGLFIGQRGIKKVRLAIPVFVLGVVTALILVGWVLAYNSELWLLILAAVIGLLVACQYSFPAWFYVLVAALIAVLVGLDSGQAELTGNKKIAALVGTGIGAFLCLVYSAGMAEFLTKPWQRIGIRILGSWIAASAIIVLSLTMMQPAT